MYNELLQLIEENEKNEQNWEKIIESEEGGQINMVKMETLDQKMERKHQKFEQKLAEFEQATESKTSVQRDIQTILEAVEDIREKAKMLDRIVEESNKELEKGDAEAIDRLELQ